MDILIIGGTKFLGRALCDVVIKKEYNLTLFNRGKTNPDLFPDIERIQGDRDGELKNIGDRTWDVVIDTCGYVPRVVKMSAEYLKDKVKKYVFISTISVYKESTEVNRNEDAKLIELEDKTTEDINESVDTYGGLKVLCENVVNDTYDQAIIIRPGLIVGPYDPTNRFTYWLVRIRKGGNILAPGNGNNPIQFIDVRDLAEFTINLIEKQVTGTFNATGPDYRVTLKSFFETCKSISSVVSKLFWAENKWLLDQKVQPWMEMPLWIPSESGVALMQVGIEPGIKHGLRFRSLDETIENTLDWYDTTNGDKQEWPAGLKPDKETELLKKLASVISPTEIIISTINELKEKGAAPGLEIGELAPEFTAKDQNLNEVKLSQFLNKQNVVISFYRGDWCGYCRSELEHFQEFYEEIKSLDAEILSIAPQTPEIAKKLESRLNLNLPLLSDPDLKISNDYKLTWEMPPKFQDVYIKNFKLNIPELNANGTWQLPSPATFIINKSGKIVNRFVDLNYSKRMEIKDIISTLRNIKSEQ